MPRRKTILRAPTNASLPNNLLIPSTTPSLVKTLSKLPRSTLLNLALEWLDDSKKTPFFFQPFLERDLHRPNDTNIDTIDDYDETNPYPAATSVDEVKRIYHDLQERKGSKREVIDRILEGDWRQGITLRQLAMIDMRYMDEHPSRLRWTALELTRIGMESESESNKAGGIADFFSGCLPRISMSTFLENIQLEISPLVKAHYYLSRSSSLPITFLRIFVTDSPYQYPRQSPDIFTDGSKIVYVAFPDSSPYIYTSFASFPPSSSSSSSSSSTGGSKAAISATVTDTRNLRRIVVEAIPKALSRPHERYTLRPTSLTTKNFSALLALRGPGRSNNANGAFSIFADAVVDGSPLDPRQANAVSPEEYINGQYAATHTSTTSTWGKIKSEKGNSKSQQNNSIHDEEERDPNYSSHSKKRKRTIDSRFGTTGSFSSAPVDRLDIKMLDSPVPPSSSSSSFIHGPALALTFAGSDVISGIRKLAELGIVDPERMPSWMTGEEAVSVASIRRGKRIIQDSG